jgi:sulfite reductase (NADPH) flavoprotein alpha-component
MAGDVHKALIELISEHGKRDHEAAEKYLQELEASKRYQKDTWF